MQGLNTTDAHRHDAMIGIYGMLGIGMIVFTLLPARLWQAYSASMHSYWYGVGYPAT